MSYPAPGSPGAALSGPPRILVVDDDPSVRSLLVAWLKNDGCRLAVAHDAATAATRG